LEVRNLLREKEDCMRRSYQSTFFLASVEAGLGPA